MPTTPPDALTASDTGDCDARLTAGRRPPDVSVPPALRVSDGPLFSCPEAAAVRGLATRLALDESGVIVDDLPPAPMGVAGFFADDPGVGAMS